MKKTVIYHSADFDGIFCREIARKFLPDAELIGWDWSDKPIPFPSEGAVYVLDLSPDCFESLPAHQERLIWIDHHKSAIDKFPTVWPGYRIDGVAACRLAWVCLQHLVPETGFPNEFWERPTKQDFIDRKFPEPLAVRLAGEYDIWDKRDPRADILQFGLRSRVLSDGDWKQLLSMNERPSIEEVERLIDVGHAQNLLEPDGTSIPVILHGILKDGELLQSYQQNADAGTIRRSFIVEFEGLKFLALNTARCNSLTFAVKDVPETGHDALMGFFFDGEKWNVSLYHANHRKDLDLSTIAVKYVYNGKSGGGHRGACGFATGNLPGISKLPFISA